METLQAPVHEPPTNNEQVYKGSDEILLSKLILDPTHSILTQSFDSRLRLDMRRPHNGPFATAVYFSAG